MFPIIESISDLRSQIGGRTDLVETKHPNGCSVFCYMYATPETFNNAFARECRGITFDPSGKILARSLHKFFNVGEKEFTLPHNLDWSNVDRVMDKRDGSMITAMVLNDNIVVKTKKSFETEQASNALKFIQEFPNYEMFIRYVCAFGYTPTFEWTSPKNRIVLDYKSDELVLLHIRHNVTGQYLKPENYGNDFNIPVVEYDKPEISDHKQFLDSIKAGTMTEGKIIQFNDGEMVKIKTDWYCSLHHSVTFLRVRDVAEAVLLETVDDLKAQMVTAGLDITPVINIEKKIFSDIATLEKNIVGAYSEFTHLSVRQEFFEAVKAKYPSFYSLVVAYGDGKDLMLTKYYMKNFLKTFSLEEINVSSYAT